MTRQRFENIGPDRQRVLFETAAEEFAANGFDGASLNRILERSGFSKSSLYYYFDDKADLFTTLLERSLAVLFNQIGDFNPAALTADTFWNDLEDYYAKAVALVSGNRWLMKFGGMFYGLRADPKQVTTTGRLFTAARHWVGAIIARGQELGAIRADLPDSLLIDSAMGLLESLDRWVVAHWNEIDESTRAEMPASHIALFRDLLGAKRSAQVCASFPGGSQDPSARRPRVRSGK
jgi:AcrR family transcriptional regulator